MAAVVQVRGLGACQVSDMCVGVWIFLEFRWTMMAANTLLDSEYLGCKMSSSVAFSCLLSCSIERMVVLLLLVCGVDPVGRNGVLCVVCWLYIRVFLVLNSTYAF